MTVQNPLDESAEALLKRAHTLSNEEETKRLYHDWAQTYEETMIDGLGYLSPQKAAKLLSLNVKNKGAYILDVGTGTGLVGMELSQLGYTNIDGQDYSAPMLEVAREKSVYKDLIEADLNQSLTIDDEKYDALICIGTFTHGHVGADCLDELFRIMKVGGRFITIIRTNYWEPAGFAAKINEFTQAGSVKTIIKEKDSNYTNSENPESWFIVWEKCLNS